MFSTKSAAFGAVTFVLMSGSIALAQQAGDDPRINKIQTVKVSTTPSPKMTISEVGQMLKNLGYQFKSVTRQNGAVVHELDVPNQGKVVFLDISLSQDGTKVWLQCVMTQLSNGQTIPSHIQQKLLESNAKTAPNFFSLSNNLLIFQSSLDNRSVNSEELRNEINIFVQLVNQTEALWNHAKWSGQ